MLNIGGKHPLIAGNIGTVSCSVAEKATNENIIVLEASSFQLMGTESFRPKIAIWTNLYDAHLDYHGTSEAYADSKMRTSRKIKRKQDYFIYNDDQPELRKYAARSAAMKFLFH